jgi:hypothetical protein
MEKLPLNLLKAKKMSMRLLYRLASLLKMTLIT